MNHPLCCIMIFSLLWEPLGRLSTLNPWLYTLGSKPHICFTSVGEVQAWTIGRACLLADSLGCQVGESLRLLLVVPRDLCCLPGRCGWGCDSSATGPTSRASAFPFWGRLSSRSLSSLWAHSTSQSCPSLGNGWSVPTPAKEAGQGASQRLNPRTRAFSVTAALDGWKPAIWFVLLGFWLAVPRCQPLVDPIGIVLPWLCLVSLA